MIKKKLNMNKFKIDEEITYYDTKKTIFCNAKIKLIVFEKEKISYVMDKKITIDEKNVLPKRNNEEVKRLNERVADLINERSKKTIEVTKEIDEKFKEIFNF